MKFEPRVAGATVSVRVVPESPNQPDVIAPIADLDAYQDSLYPAEARYALDMGSLCRPNVIFVVARTTQGAAIGCGAVVLTEDHDEVKRMYVCPESRGQGVAEQILHVLEAAAEHAGCTLLVLETGPLQPQALRFYEQQGYRRQGPFGGYPDHPQSVFMSKRTSVISP